MNKQETLNLLFVCSMNQWRSPTAEKIYSNRAFLRTRSAGTKSGARKTLSPADLSWADLILVMEEHHKKQILEKYSGEIKGGKIHVLDIPDIYGYMESELIREIEAAVEPILATYAQENQ